MICAFPVRVKQNERKEQREREQLGGSYSANKGVGRDRREGCGGGWREEGREMEKMQTDSLQYSVPGGTARWFRR